MTTELVTDDGRVLATDLTHGEIVALVAAGVRLDAESTDDPAHEGGQTPADDAVVDAVSTTTDTTPGDGDGDVGDADAADDADALADALDALDAFDDATDLDDAVGEWWDAGAFAEYSSLDDIDHARYDELLDAIDDARHGMGARIKNRDERAANPKGINGRDIRAAVHDDDLLDQLKAALRELTTRDRDEPATSGHSLNIDAVVRHHAGAFAERDFYLHRDPAETGDRAVSVALDLSGSMNEFVALKSIAALAEATEVVGDDFMAVSFQSESTTRLITAPGEAFDYDHLNAVSTGGSTPTALGIREAHALVENANKPEKLIVVITDGKANKSLPENGAGSLNAQRDAVQMIHNARAAGVKVIGLGVSAANTGYMTTLFGNDFVVTDMTGLVPALVEIYRRQMKTATMY